MKVLFLDIDGVLNKHTTKERYPYPPWEGMVGLDAAIVEKYLDWRKYKDISVVLSSSWRLHPETFDYLNNNGIFWSDLTPREISWRNGNSKQRGAEIAAWLKQHPETTHYAILDDCAVKHNHLVMTSYYHGLQDKHLRLVDKYLDE